MAYLDDTGLAYFWGKIKAWANSVFALLGHTHPSSDVTLMTGYSKPSVSSAIAASDTLNQAVGKLEAKVDEALDDSGFVHTTGTETVGGVKTFTSPVYIENSNSRLVEKITGYARGTSASESFYVNRLSVIDNNGLPLVAVYHRLDHSTNAHLVSFNCYKFNSTSNNDYISLAVGYDEEGYAHAFCPSTSSHRTAATDIVTRDWIPKDTRIVHTTGAEDIAGAKTFKNEPAINKTGQVMWHCECTDANSGYSLAIGIGQSKKAGFYNITTSKWLYEWVPSTGTFTINAVTTGTAKALVGDTSGNLKWNGQTVQTSSDERLKTPITDVNSDILDTWSEVQWGEFKFLEAVDDKGENARYHVGLIAQSVDRVFKNRGRDILKYGILCHDEREATEEDEAVDEWQIRYTEALCMEAACQRRENARLKARLAALEDRLAALELRLGSE